VLELDNDIGPGVETALDGEGLCLDELYVDLALGRGRGGRVEEDALGGGHGGDGGEGDGWLADGGRGVFRTGDAAEEEGMDEADEVKVEHCHSRGVWTLLDLI